jgi:protein-histidine pros-kinase
MMAGPSAFGRSVRRRGGPLKAALGDVLMDAAFDATALEHHPEAVVVLDPSGMVLHWNRAAEALFEYGAAEVARKACSDFVVAPDHADSFARLLHKAGVESLSVDDFLCHRKDGTCLQVRASAKAVRGADGVVDCVVVTLNDVTRQTRLRDTRLAEARYADLLDDIPDAILIVNAAGLIVMANAPAQALFGDTREALIGRPVEALLHDRGHGSQAGHRARFYARQQRTTGAELRLYGRRRDGREFPAEIRLNPLPDNVLVLCAVRDLSHREEDFSKAEGKFRDLLESAPDAMVIVDAGGRIVLVNSQAVQLFGWSRGELLGQPIETLVPLRYRGSHTAHRQGYASERRVRQMGAGLELLGLRKDGNEFPIEVSLGPIETEDGPLVVSAIRDASDRKRIEQTLHEASRLKSEFLAGMSHELRTPLNGILGFSELLVDQRLGPLNDKQREYIGDIHQCGKHLLELINDVLDLSKVEAGKMEVYAEAFPLPGAVASVCSMLTPMARKKRIRLLTQIPDGLGEVLLDAQKVKQILFNLLSNAVKFTDEGGQVMVSLEADADLGVILKVRDNGIGIAADDLHRLFEVFHQLDGGASRRHEGTGLGLALTRKLVELQGGRITVHSTPGEGSTFEVWLPREYAAAARPA